MNATYLLGALSIFMVIENTLWDINLILAIYFNES